MRGKNQEGYLKRGGFLTKVGTFFPFSYNSLFPNNNDIHLCKILEKLFILKKEADVQMNWLQ